MGGWTGFRGRPRRPKHGLDGLDASYVRRVLRRTVPKSVPCYIHSTGDLNLYIHSPQIYS